MIKKHEYSAMVWLVENLNTVGIFGEESIYVAILDIYNNKVPAEKKSNEDDIIVVVYEYAKNNPIIINDIGNQNYVVIGSGKEVLYDGPDKRIAVTIHARHSDSNLFVALPDAKERIQTIPADKMFCDEESANSYLTREFVDKGMRTKEGMEEKKRELLSLIPPSQRSSYHPNDNIAIAEFYLFMKGDTNEKPDQE